MDWTKIKYFSKDENWGDISKIQDDLIYRLDKMREYAGRPFIIHCAYELTGHSKNSYHKLGMAVDGHFKDINLIDQFLIADKFFGDAGIGIYGRDVWNNPGLHLDIRPYIARWAYKKGAYISISNEYFQYLIVNELT